MMDWGQASRYFKDRVDSERRLNSLLEGECFREPITLSGLCNVVSEHLRQAVEDEFGCRAVVTIGSVEEGGVSVFNTPFNAARARELTRQPKRSLNHGNYSHHAWLTLDSGEILDMTICSMIAVGRRNLSSAEYDGYAMRILFGLPEELAPGWVYYPTLVGTTFYSEYDTNYSDLLERHRQGERNR
jgi:hypothetical protein